MSFNQDDPYYLDWDPQNQKDPSEWPEDPNNSFNGSNLYNMHPSNLFTNLDNQAPNGNSENPQDQNSGMIQDIQPDYPSMGMIPSNTVPFGSSSSPDFQQSQPSPFGSVGVQHSSQRATPSHSDNSSPLSARDDYSVGEDAPVLETTLHFFFDGEACGPRTELWTGYVEPTYEEESLKNSSTVSDVLRLGSGTSLMISMVTGYKVFIRASTQRDMSQPQDDNSNVLLGTGDQIISDSDMKIQLLILVHRRVGTNSNWSLCRQMYHTFSANNPFGFSPQEVKNVCYVLELVTPTGVAVARTPVIKPYTERWFREKLKKSKGENKNIHLIPLKQMHIGHYTSKILQTSHKVDELTQLNRQLVRDIHNLREENRALHDQNGSWQQLWTALIKAREQSRNRSPLFTSDNSLQSFANNTNLSLLDLPPMNIDMILETMLDVTWDPKAVNQLLDYLKLPVERIPENDVFFDNNEPFPDGPLPKLLRRSDQENTLLSNDMEWSVSDFSSSPSVAEQPASPTKERSRSPSPTRGSRSPSPVLRRSTEESNSRFTRNQRSLMSKQSRSKKTMENRASQSLIKLEELADDSESDEMENFLTNQNEDLGSITPKFSQAVHESSQPMHQEEKDSRFSSLFSFWRRKNKSKESEKQQEKSINTDAFFNTEDELYHIKREGEVKKKANLQRRNSNNNNDRYAPVKASLPPLKPTPNYGGAPPLQRPMASRAPPRGPMPSMAGPPPSRAAPPPPSNILPSSSSSFQLPVAVLKHKSENQSANQLFSNSQAPMPQETLQEFSYLESGSFAPRPTNLYSGNNVLPSPPSTSPLGGSPYSSAGPSSPLSSPLHSPRNEFRKIKEELEEQREREVEENIRRSGTPPPPHASAKHWTAYFDTFDLSAKQSFVPNPQPPPPTPGAVILKANLEAIGILGKGPATCAEYTPAVPARLASPPPSDNSSPIHFEQLQLRDTTSRRKSNLESLSVRTLANQFDSTTLSEPDPIHLTLSLPDDNSHDFRPFHFSVGTWCDVCHQIMVPNNYCSECKLCLLKSCNQCLDQVRKEECHPQNRTPSPKPARFDKKILPLLLQLESSVWIVSDEGLWERPSSTQDPDTVEIKEGSLIGMQIINHHKYTIYLSIMKFDENNNGQLINPCPDQKGNQVRILPYAKNSPNQHRLQIILGHLLPISSSSSPEYTYRLIATTDGTQWKKQNPTFLPYTIFESPESSQGGQECLVKKTVRVIRLSNSSNNNNNKNGSKSKDSKTLVSVFIPKQEKDFIPVGGVYSKEKWKSILEGASREPTPEKNN